MKRTKKLVIGLMVWCLVGAMSIANAADFNTATAKFKFNEQGCLPLAQDEVSKILYEVNDKHTRGYLKSLSFYDINGTQNFLFMFSDGTTKSGLPKYLTTFTTMEGCIKFMDRPEQFAPYLR